MGAVRVLFADRCPPTLPDGGLRLESADGVVGELLEDVAGPCHGAVQGDPPRTRGNVPEEVIAKDVEGDPLEFVLPEYVTERIPFPTASRRVFRPRDFARKSVAIQTVHEQSGKVHPGNPVLEQLGTGRKSAGGGLVIWGHVNEYGPHYHVLHGCKYTGNRCQCFKSGGWLADLGFPTGDAIRYRSDQLDAAHWRDLWLHCTKGDGYRALLLCQSDRRGPFAVCRLQDLPPLWEGPFSVQGPGGCSDLDGTAQRKDGADDAAQQQAGEVQLGQARGKKEGGRTVSKVWAKLKVIAAKHWIGDFDLLLRIADVQMDEDIQHVLVFHMDAVRKYMQNHFLCDSKKVQNMKFNDIREALGECPTAFMEEDFMGREQSLLVLKHFFYHQFGQDACTMFVTFRKWFDQDLGKKNTIIMIGPPSCGKTLIANAWTRLGKYFGKITEWTKGAQFCFAGCRSGRIVLHDECIQPIEAVEHLETLKKIYAGEKNVPINVKYADGSTACGAPVIGTANQDPIRNCSVRGAFNERVNWLNLTDDPELKDLTTGAINPMALFDMWDYCFDYLFVHDTEIVLNYI